MSEVVEKKFWTGEALVAAIVGGLSLLGALVTLTGHAVIVSDHVAQLERDKDTAATKHAAYEARMQSIETTVALDRAASDKRESLIEAELRDISEKLAAIQVSVDRLHRK